MTSTVDPFIECFLPLAFKDSYSFEISRGALEIAQ